MAFWLNKKMTTGRSNKRSVGRLKPAYYKAASKADSSDLLTNKSLSKPSRKRSFRHYLHIFWFFLVLTLLGYCSIIKNNPKLEINNTSYHSAEEYKEAIVKNLNAIRNKDKLTFDSSGISKSLKKQFPELNSATIKLQLVSQIPVVKLDVAAPSFNLVSGQNVYIVGSNGVVAAKSSELSGSSKLPTLIDQSGFEAAPGKQVLGSQAIGFINILIAQCQRAKLSISSLTLPALPQELDLRAAGSNYYVKFDLNGDVNLQTGQYLVAKHQFDSQGDGPQQYLDVRIAGKIYYK